MASSVVYQKQTDGSYDVVQAVPDTKKRTTYIVSAYMQKNEGPKIPIASSDASGAHTAQSSMPPRAAQQAPDVQAPGHTPKTLLLMLLLHSLHRTGARFKMALRLLSLVKLFRITVYPEIWEIAMLRQKIFHFPNICSTAGRWSRRGWKRSGCTKRQCASWASRKERQGHKWITRSGRAYL